MDLRKNAYRGLKLLLPNGMVGTVVDISPRNTSQDNLRTGRDQIKCSYTSGFGMNTEAWFDYDKVKELKEPEAKKEVNVLENPQEQIGRSFPVGDKSFRDMETVITEIPASDEITERMKNEGADGLMAELAEQKRHTKDTFNGVSEKEKELLKEIFKNAPIKPEEHKPDKQAVAQKKETPWEDKPEEKKKEIIDNTNEENQDEYSG